MTSISVLIPALNEESTIEQVIETHIDVLNRCTKLNYISDYEIIILNDGSSDSTLEQIAKFQCSKKIIVLSNKYSSGLQKAFSTLYNSASKTWTYLTPGDAQIPSINLEKFIIEAHMLNWKVAIFGRRKKFQHYGLLRLIISFVFTKYSNFIVSQKIPDIGTVKLVPSILNKQEYMCKSVLQEIERVKYLKLFEYPIKIVDITWVARERGKSHGISFNTLISVIREIKFLKRKFDTKNLRQ